MSRGYPIWYNVESDAYDAKKKDFGIHNTGKISVKIGSSKKNSHEFFKTEITRTIEDILVEGELQRAIIFRYSVDGVIVKKATFELDKDKAGKLISIVTL